MTISAPTGYGKTTTAALWDEADERPFAWMRLDHLDDDPTHLLLHVAAALAQIGACDPGLLDYLGAPGREPLTHLVPAMAKVLDAAGRLVLVFDDTHELCAPESVAALDALIHAVPSTTTVALVSRHAVPLHLAHRRVQRCLVEIGVPELKFTTVETAAALEAVSGPCDQATVSAVTEVSEGWCAGVVLAGMALRDGAGTEFLTGGDRFVVEYMVEEVLRGLDGPTVQFLMESSVLERFSAEQLDVVLGRDDSALMLEKLCGTGNLFLVTLDRHGIWYRYHRLFGDVLRRRLRNTAPARMRELAHRAAELLERIGDIDGALLQALAAGDRAHAATLVGREAVHLGFDGRAGVLARRLSWLDTQTFTEYPDAAVARAWLGVVTADADMIQRSLLLAHQADRGRPLSDGTLSVPVAAALVNSLIGLGGVRDVVHHADIVRAAGDNLVNPWWGAATVMKGVAEAMLGHSSRARNLLESALPATEDLPGFQAAALAHLALLDFAAGDDDGAIQRATAARTLVDKYDLCDVVPMVVVYSVSAVMYARVGDVASAREAICTTTTLLDRLGELAARTALLGHGLLAWTAAVIQDNELLNTHLDAAERHRTREPDAVALQQRVDRVRAMAAVGAHPLTSAELRLLPYLATHYSLQGIAEELTIGRETAKSQAAAIYRKLGVASRAAAVAEARRIGLLAN
ncbi:LuxR C-terminal-related transcriptional regulator [Mycobacterium sp. SMC-4]|uniref:LuxR C-terminal-related transcriptional regulator n=1 Tax=Mycobacterium sp. SMC-4 TaxID=2857059 RepID=UPI003D00BB31